MKVIKNSFLLIQLVFLSFLAINTVSLCGSDKKMMSKISKNEKKSVLIIIASYIERSTDPDEKLALLTCCREPHKPLKKNVELARNIFAGIELDTELTKLYQGLPKKREELLTKLMQNFDRLDNKDKEVDTKCRVKLMLDIWLRRVNTNQS